MLLTLIDFENIIEILLAINIISNESSSKSLA